MTAATLSLPAPPPKPPGRSRKIPPGRLGAGGVGFPVQAALVASEQHEMR